MNPEIIHPELFDVIELLIDSPNLSLKVGDRGTIVEEYGGRAYEVEFTNSDGETTALRSFTSNQFIVVWKSSTKMWVPMGDRLVAMLQFLPEENQKQVLDFARSLYQTPA